MPTLPSRRLALGIAVLTLLTISPSLAVDFESFLFEDPAGTELDSAANTANPGNAWTIDFTNLVPAAVEDGVYKITKDNNNAAPAVLNVSNVNTGARYLSVDLASWAFRGFDAAEPEELRFGFLDNDDGAFAGNLVTAQMQVRRNTTTQGVEFVGDAVGPGSTNLTRNHQLSIDQTAPFRMVLELNKSSNTYEIFYKNGGSPSQSLGIGNVATARNGNSVRLFVNNNFGSDFAEFISVDRMAVTDVNPLTDLLTLEVNRNSGEMKLINTTGGPLAGLESYSILSASGALNGANWKPIAGNYDSAGNGSVDVDNAWNVSVSNVGELTEAVVAGNGGALSAGQQVVLSVAGGPWVRNPVEDLYMELRFAGGVTRSANVNFVGNGGRRFATGDLNFDGAITVNDWTTFIANSETDLSGLSSPARYQRGDLDGDGVNSSFDFIVFKTAFETANGVGSFEAMLAALPEPQTSALALLGVAGFMSRRRTPAKSVGRRTATTTMAVIAAVAVSFPGDASAGILQDFTFNDANGTAIDSAVNSASPANVWLTQNNNVESFVNGGKFRINKQTVTGQVGNTLDIANVISGKAWLVAEIGGWNYTATASSPAERVRFGFLDNTDPVAAGSSTITAEMNIDRIGDGSLQLNGMALGTGSGNVSATLSLALVRNTPLTIVLELDKELDQYSVYYRDNAGPFAPLGTANLGASTLNAGDRDGNSVRFAFTGTFGDAGEFFDVDRLYLTDTSPLNVSTDALTLRVNSTTGAVAIVNDSDTPFSIDLYRIESTANRLNAAGWNSLSDQSFGAIDGPDDGSTLGDGIGETWDEAGGSDAGVLSEMFLLGSSTFSPNSDPVSIGNAFNPGTQPPLAFQYRNATTGALLTGNVEFVTGGATPDADFDNNLFVDGADFLIWQRKLGVGSTNLEGDANGDGQVTTADLTIWKSQFGDPAPAISSTSAVPEPSCVAIVFVALATVRRFTRGQYWTQIRLPLGSSASTARRA